MDVIGFQYKDINTIMLSWRLTQVSLHILNWYTSDEDHHHVLLQAWMMLGEESNPSAFALIFILSCDIYKCGHVWWHPTFIFSNGIVFLIVFGSIKFMMMHPSHWWSLMLIAWTLLENGIEPSIGVIYN